MELNRAGNPLLIYWDFNIKKTDGTVEMLPLEGKPLRLTLITPRGKKEIKDYKVYGNIIEWLFSAKYQTTYGDHSLLLEVLSPSGEVVSASDQCKFVRIIDSSCIESDNDVALEIPEDEAMQVITLSTEMSVVRVMPVYPEIGPNGNWWIDGVDTGKPSRGEPGSGGEGGSGLQYAVERTVYPTRMETEGYEPTDVEITEEERAYNIETYDMAWNRMEPVFVSYNGVHFNVIVMSDDMAVYNVVSHISNTFGYNGLYSLTITITKEGDAIFSSKLIQTGGGSATPSDMNSDFSNDF